MRKALTLCLAIVLVAVMLMGCSRNPDDAAEADPEVTREIYDTGEFRMLVPEGWRVFPITDPFAEGQPVKTDCVFLRKGGKSDWHVFEKPYIRMEYFGPDRQMERSMPETELWRNVEDVQSMQFGDLVWDGYTADDYHGRACIGRYAILWAENGDHKYRVFIWFKSGGESIELEDHDVQAILASVEPSGDETEPEEIINSQKG